MDTDDTCRSGLMASSIIAVPPIINLVFATGVFAQEPFLQPGESCETRFLVPQNGRVDMYNSAKSLTIAGATALVFVFTAPLANAKSSAKKSCLTHAHLGVASDKNKTKAYRGAYKDWENQVTLHDGASWASTNANTIKINSQGCTKEYDHPTPHPLPNAPWHWKCLVTAKPCRWDQTIFPLTKPMPLLPGGSPWLKTPLKRKLKR